MQKPLQIRLAVIVLALSTVFAGVFAFLNFVQEGKYQRPADGVWWTESRGGLEAQRVLDNGPGMRAGIKAGDLLIAANDRPTPEIAALVREMYRTGVYGRANYTLIRSGVRVDVPVILETPDRSINQGFRVIALVYLLIGLVCSVSPLDSAEVDAFLRLLPALICFVCLSLHGQIQFV